MTDAFQSEDLAFEKITGRAPKMEHLATGFGFIEGPVWIDDHLLFTDIPNNRIVKYEMLEEGPRISTFRYPSGNANGMTIDNEGCLVACEHTNRRVTRTEHHGKTTVLANRYEGRRLNSPNDVVVKSDGSVYFTDPPFGLPGQSQGRELDFQGVFRISQDGQVLTPVVMDMDRPNGLVFSIGEDMLYVADSAKKHIKVFNVESNGMLSQGRIFAEMESDKPGVPDGMKLDIEGNLYSTGPGGVWVFRPDGKVIGRIVPPQIPANCAWGDADRKSLYLTARTGLYRVRLSIPGVKAGGIS